MLSSQDVSGRPLRQHSGSETDQPGRTEHSAGVQRERERPLHRDSQTFELALDAQWSVAG